MTTILDIVKEVNGQSSDIHSIKRKKVSNVHRWTWIL
jgi:hypothetical protein